jgi:hypothetical protein
MPYNRLETTGLFFATVSTVGQPISHNDGFADIMEISRGLGLEHLQASSYPNGETLLDAYLQTILHGRVKERFPSIIVTTFPTLVEVREEVTRLATHPESTQKSTLLEGYRATIMSWARGSRIFAMSNSYIGIINGLPQPGKQAHHKGC